MLAQKIKVLIADDHIIFRRGLKMLLASIDGIELVGEAENGLDLLAVAGRYTPDVFLIDISMPVMDGVMATKELCKRHPGAKVIALSVFGQESHIMEMLDAGALGYLMKNADKDDIEQAIVSVFNNRSYFCTESNKQVKDLIEKFQSGSKKHLIVFSEREKDIITLICKGFISKEIACTLYLSQRTVEGHRTRVMQKMGVKSMAGLVTYACEKGLYGD